MARLGNGYQQIRLRGRAGTVEIARVRVDKGQIVEATWSDGTLVQRWTARKRGPRANRPQLAEF